MRAKKKMWMISILCWVNNCIKFYKYKVSVGTLLIKIKKNSYKNIILRLFHGILIYISFTVFWNIA